MAQQQHRQACLARWPGHHSKSTEARRRRRNSQECSQRSKVEHQGGDTTVQPRLWQQGHRPGAAPARRRHRAHGRAAKHSRAAASGLQQPSNRRDDEEDIASTGERGQELQQSSPEEIKPHGQDLLGRSSVAMAAIGGGGDETPRSGGTARRGRAEEPSSGDGSRRSSPESGKELIGDSIARGD
jgi:hypothetical protein